LQAGRAIYLCEDDTPAGLVVKEHPDGRRELVQFDQDGEKVGKVGQPKLPPHQQDEA
jgi:hypothetical protein